MGSKSSILLVFLFVFFSLEGPVFALSCKSVTSGEISYDYESLMSEVSHARIKGLNVPYIDLNSKSKKTMVLVSGFSMSMLTWLSQVNLLVNQGYRVILVENTNIGLNLKKNGLVEHDSNQGLYFDGETLAKLILKLKPKGPLRLVGHSRGGAVAAIAADGLREKGQRVKAVKLFSTYVDYIWESSFLTTMSLKWVLDYQPTLFGRGLDHNDSEPRQSADEVIGLEDSLRQKGYAYVFKGIQPLSDGEVYSLSYSLERLSLRTRASIEIYGVINDDELSPMNKALELSSNRVNVVIFDDEPLTHYWPLEDPKRANEIINE